MVVDGIVLVVVVAAFSVSGTVVVEVVVLLVLVVVVVVVVGEDGPEEPLNSCMLGELVSAALTTPVVAIAIMDSATSV